MVPRRNRRWEWAGRVIFAVIVVAVVVYLAVVGLDKADKLASAIGAVLAVVALGAPYLLPPPQAGGVSLSYPDRIEDSGKAVAKGGGRANTGLEAAGDDRPAQVLRSGDATAEGSGSVANTGVQRSPRP